MKNPGSFLNGKIAPFTNGLGEAERTNVEPLERPFSLGKSSKVGSVALNSP